MTFLCRLEGIKSFCVINFTWDMFRPADDDHQLAVSQIAQRGQSLDVPVRHGGVGHGVDLLRLHDQQVGNDLRHWRQERTKGLKRERRCGEWGAGTHVAFWLEVGC